MGKRMLFIFNPRAGKGSIKNRLVDILDIFVKAGYEVTVHPTQAYRDGQRVARRKGGEYDLLVTSGGDGTLDEIVTGIMEGGHSTPVGYIPAGSTNDFANSLHVSKNMLEAAVDIVEGRAHAFDVGKFNDDFFVYIAAFGLFTDVSYETNQDLKNILGHAAYILEGTQRLFNIRSYNMAVESAQCNMEGEFIFGMVTNTISVGGFKGLVTQNVALNDGEFEVLLIRTPRTPLDLSNIVNYMFLKEEPNEYVHKFRTKALTVIPEEPVDWVLDGEFGGTRMETQIINLQKQIRIMRNPSKKQ